MLRRPSSGRALSKVMQTSNRALPPLLPCPNTFVSCVSIHCRRANLAQRAPARDRGGRLPLWLRQVRSQRLRMLIAPMSEEDDDDAFRVTNATRRNGKGLGFPESGRSSTYVKSERRGWSSFCQRTTLKMSTHSYSSGTVVGRMLRTRRTFIAQEHALQSLGSSVVKIEGSPSSFQ